MLQKVSSSSTYSTYDLCTNTIHIDTEDFAVKSKFPPSLRPTVLAAGTIIFRQLNGPDDNFLNHLMAILPYNKFTLRVSDCGFVTPDAKICMLTLLLF